MGYIEDSITQEHLQSTDAMFDCLTSFIKVAREEDKPFTIFLYNLSHYKDVSNLPMSIVDMEGLLEEIDEWLQYFPQAQLRAKGRNVYTSILIGLSLPFITLIKKLSCV